MRVMLMIMFLYVLRKCPLFLFYLNGSTLYNAKTLLTTTRPMAENSSTLPFFMYLLRKQQIPVIDTLYTYSKRVKSRVSFDKKKSN